MCVDSRARGHTGLSALSHAHAACHMHFVPEVRARSGGGKTLAGCGESRGVMDLGVRRYLMKRLGFGNNQVADEHTPGAATASAGPASGPRSSRTWTSCMRRLRERPPAREELESWRVDSAVER
eukprot:389944-Rhodomonas_salina.2